MTVTMNGAERIDYDDGRLTTITAGGRSTRVRAGDAATILAYVAQQFHERVEPLQTFHGWRSLAVNTASGGIGNSNHLSGTALDCNGGRHPRYRAGTFTREQVGALRAILADVNAAAGETVLRWGGDWGSQVDEMHLELVGSPAAWARAAASIRATAPVSNPGHTTTPIPGGVQVTPPDPIQPLEEDDRMLTLAKLKGTKGVYIGDGVTRRLVKTSQELKDIKWQMDHGILRGKPEVLVVDRIDWLGKKV